MLVPIQLTSAWHTPARLFAMIVALNCGSGGSAEGFGFPLLDMAVSYFAGDLSDSEVRMLEGAASGRGTDYSDVWLPPQWS